MDDLVHQSERLAMMVNPDLEMPRLKRNLSQLIEAGNQLWNRTVGSSANRDASEVRASVLLGAKGYDYQKVSRNLDNLVSRAVKNYTTIANQSLQPVARETDIQGFLKNERESAIMQVIEEVKTISREQVEKQYLHTLSKDWDKEKSELLNSATSHHHDANDLDLSNEINMGSVTTFSNRNESTFLCQTKLRNNLSMSSPLADRSSYTIVDPKATRFHMDYTEVLYARCLVGYVDKVVKSAPRPDLIRDFIESLRKDVSETSINDLWDTVSSIISCVEEVKPGSDPIKIRQGLPFQVRFVMSARILLERKYREYAETTVHGSLNNLSNDLDPLACYNLMKNFLSLKSPAWLSNYSLVNSTINEASGNTDDGMIEGHPVWNFIWHCLRAGMVEAAILVAQKSKNKYISEDFVEILESYNEKGARRLASHLENQMRVDYKTSVGKTNDIYKKAVFNMLASCDLTFVEASDRVEDYLWLRLCQIRFEHSNNELEDLVPVQQSTPYKTTIPQTLIVSNKLTLPQLQNLVSEDLGEAHFNAQENPLSFFKVLFLTGQFEQAIEFLFRFNRLRAHAMHVGISLNELGLLIKPVQYLSLPIISKVENTNPKGGIIKSLNYTNILIRYTKKFAHHNTTEALYYYYLLRNCTNENKENLFVTSVSELVRETRDFDNLLGYANDFGRMRGVIDGFNLDVDEIVSKVAEDCESCGQYEEAVKLYDSTSKYGKVLELMIKLLSEVLPGRKSDKSERDRLEALALKIAKRYSDKPEVDAPRDIAGTFNVLLHLLSFFNYYHTNQYADALDVIESVKLLPFARNEVEVKAREFNKYPEEVRRNISDILLATMNMLYISFKDQPNMEVREKAKALITFSGMIQYRMPSDTIARLIELEVLIN